MDQQGPVLTLLQNALTPAVLIGVTLWNSDKALSEAGAKALYQAIEHTTQNPRNSEVARALESFLDQFFSPRKGWATFLASVLVLTVVSLLIVLAVYTYRMSGLFDQLLTRGFLVQFIGNGLVVTFVVNCVVFSQYRHLLASFAADSTARNLGLVLLDLLAKAVLFIVLTALTYVLLATLGSAFRGDALAALGAVPITVREAVLFRNLTSVYIYSLILSSFPIFVVIVVKLMIASPAFSAFVQRLFFWLPLKDKPLRLATCAFAVFTGLFVLTFSLLLWWVR
jgi:hypothetical protein